MASFAVGTRHRVLDRRHRTQPPTHPRRIAWMKYDHLRLLLVICASVRGNGLSHRPQWRPPRRAVLTSATFLPFASAASTASATVNSLSGATVLITGNSPVSIEAAKLMAAVGARVVTTARSQRRAEADAASIAANVSVEAGRDVVGLALDLGNLTEIRAFPEILGNALGSQEPYAIDVLVCSAQGESPFNSERTFTKDGLDRHIGVSHLGHFALLAALLPNLQRASKGFRVLAVSSESHREVTRSALLSAVDESFDFVSEDSFGRYRISKALNVLFAVELQRRIASLGLRGSAEVIGLEDPRVDLMVPIEPVARTLFRLAAAADSGSDRTATPPSLYVRGSSGSSSPPSEAASDQLLARKLWVISERLTGTNALRLEE